MNDWYVNASHGWKVVHRAACRYAKPDQRYVWAAGLPADQLAAWLIDRGASGWHKGCRYCAADLDNQLRDAGHNETERAMNDRPDDPGPAG